MLQLIETKTIGTNSSMRWRIAISAAIGLASGVFCWFLMVHFHQDAADFRWALRLARYVLQRQNPYNTPLEQYPLTAGFFALPFLRFTPEVAAGLFWGISSALLAFGLTRDGYGRLRIFLAYPFWAGILTVQWSPIIAAGAFFPLLLPVTSARLATDVTERPVPQRREAEPRRRERPWRARLERSAARCARKIRK